jgi:hypothetical protein
MPSPHQKKKKKALQRKMPINERILLVMSSKPCDKPDATYIVGNYKNVLVKISPRKAVETY